MGRKNDGIEKIQAMIGRTAGVDSKYDARMGTCHRYSNNSHLYSWRSL